MQPRSPPAPALPESIDTSWRHCPEVLAGREPILDRVGLVLRVHEDVARAHLGELRRILVEQPSAARRQRGSSPPLRRAGRRSAPFCSTSASWNDFGKPSKASRPNCVSTSSRAAASMSGVIVAPRALFSWRATSTTISRWQRLAGEVGRDGVAAVARHRRLAGRRDPRDEGGVVGELVQRVVERGSIEGVAVDCGRVGFTVEQAEPTSAAAATAAARPTILSRGCTAGEPTGGPPAAHRQAGRSSRKKSTHHRRQVGPSSAPAAAPRRAPPCTRLRVRGDGT